MECGVLEHGFARVRCERCKDEFLVAFWCKGRGVCPSCNAKRAHVTAVQWVEQVLPHVPYRQWTLSFPHRVRWKAAGLDRRVSAGDERLLCRLGVRLMGSPSASLTSRSASARYAQEGSCPSYALSGKEVRRVGKAPPRA
ncbi:transposase zinc-binding domain-containing protein [Stigmatella hybrida]|uniref:transposase zinc-binding domain-containing protein n=1 Tax=Stigmatella hybrida TaxID=394097 RepID=UPI0021E174F6|nr:transposase zinc-binding domain-containing protein [Stigmatella hybrida]